MAGILVRRMSLVGVEPMEAIDLLVKADIFALQADDVSLDRAQGLVAIVGSGSHCLYK
jgi:hypothetical protein